MSRQWHSTSDDNTDWKSWIGKIVHVSSPNTSVEGEVIAFSKECITLFVYTRSRDESMGYNVIYPANQTDVTRYYYPIIQTKERAAIDVLSPEFVEELEYKFGIPMYERSVEYNDEEVTDFSAWISQHEKDHQYYDLSRVYQYPVMAMVKNLLNGKGNTVVHIEYGEQSMDQPLSALIEQRRLGQGFEGRVLRINDVQTAYAKHISITMEVWDRIMDERDADPHMIVDVPPNQQGKIKYYIPVVAPPRPLVVTIVAPTVATEIFPLKGYPTYYEVVLEEEEEEES